MTPNVWIGSALRNREARNAVQDGVTAVLDLTAEFSAPRAFRKLRYRNIPILDLTAPTIEQLEEMATFIAAEAERGIVYVHCKIGYSRSAAAVGGVSDRDRSRGERGGEPEPIAPRAAFHGGASRGEAGVD